MFISNAGVDRMHEAAEALSNSPVDVVYADVPVYENYGVLHPQVAKPEEGIHPRFTFQKFGLAVVRPNVQAVMVRLIPPVGKQVSTPVPRPKQEEFVGELPRTGFAALRAIVLARGGDLNPFFLFGEDRLGELQQSLKMTASAELLVKVVSGQVHAKAGTEALSN